MTVALRLLEGPFVSIQDAGRPGHARHGVGAAGPMDPLGRLLALRLLGVGDASALERTPTIELGPGGGRLRVEGGGLDLAVAGPRASLRLDLDEVPAPAVVRVPPGGEVVVTGTARWTSLAVAGALDVAPVLGSVSRHGRTGLGPAWDVGDVLAVGPRDRDAPPVVLGARPPPRGTDQPLMLLDAPQTHLFPAAQRSLLGGGGLTIGSAGDRMAQRVDGVRLSPSGGHDIVSDGVVAGAVQVQGDGAPWVVLAEHQPTGGYPKVAVLAAADRCRFVHLAPGDPVRFAWGDVPAARDRWDAAVAAVERVVRSAPRPTADRLRDARLAGPWVPGPD